MKHLPPDWAKHPDPVGFQADRVMGEKLAQAKIKATKTAFSEAYGRGVRLWMREAATPKGDRQLGENAAKALLQERRKALLGVLYRTVTYSGITGAIACIIGVSITLIPLVILPSLAIAVWMSRLS